MIKCMHDVCDKGRPRLIPVEVQCSDEEHESKAITTRLPRITCAGPFNCPAVASSTRTTPGSQVLTGTKSLPSTPVAPQSDRQGETFDGYENMAVVRHMDTVQRSRSRRQRLTCAGCARPSPT